MGERADAGKEPVCIYCQSAPAEEWDHTLPRSWYPDGTDPKLQRLTVPSCSKQVNLVAGGSMLPPVSLHQYSDSPVSRVGHVGASPVLGDWA